MHADAPRDSAKNMTMHPTTSSHKQELSDGVIKENTQSIKHLTDSCDVF